MSKDISFLKNEFHSLSLNFESKNDNFSSKYTNFLNESPFESCYDVEKIIGSGGFAVVYSGTRKSNNKQYAIKHIDKKKITSWFTEEDGVDIPMEIVLLVKSEEVEGANVMVEYFERFDSFIIILEKPQNCRDLFDEITGKERLDERQARRVFVDVVNILISLEECGIFHNDVKDENIIIDLDTSKVTLIDFGSGVLRHEGDDDIITHFEGTRVYSPPEWVEHGEMSLRSGSVWSMGVLLYNMTCGDVPYHTDDAIITNVLPPCEHLSHECRDLISSCLQGYSHLRPSFSHILTHPWILNSDDDDDNDDGGNDDSNANNDNYNDNNNNNNNDNN